MADILFGVLANTNKRLRDMGDETHAEVVAATPAPQTAHTATIANGESVSAAITITNESPLAILMPAAWTTAAVTLEASWDGGTTWRGVIYDATGSQCNSIASPAVSAVYALSLDGLLSLSGAQVRLRSGTTASPVNQGGARTIVLITRPLV
jgi:hypothetical protein